MLTKFSWMKSAVYKGRTNFRGGGSENFYTLGTKIQLFCGRPLWMASKSGQLKNSVNHQKQKIPSVQEIPKKILHIKNSSQKRTSKFLLPIPKFNNIRRRKILKINKYFYYRIKFISQMQNFFLLSFFFFIWLCYIFMNLLFMKHLLTSFLNSIRLSTKVK